MGITDAPVKACTGGTISREQCHTVRQQESMHRLVESPQQHPLEMVKKTSYSRTSRTMLPLAGEALQPAWSQSHVPAGRGRQGGCHIPAAQCRLWLCRRRLGHSSELSLWPRWDPPPTLTSPPPNVLPPPCHAGPTGAAAAAAPGPHRPGRAGGG